MEYVIAEYKDISLLIEKILLMENNQYMSIQLQKHCDENMRILMISFRSLKNRLKSFLCEVIINCW